MKDKQFSLALADLNICVQNDKSKCVSLIHKADCLKSIGNYQEAITLYSTLIDRAESFQKHALIAKRAICLYENK